MSSKRKLTSRAPKEPPRVIMRPDGSQNAFSVPWVEIPTTTRANPITMPRMVMVSIRFIAHSNPAGGAKPLRLFRTYRFILITSTSISSEVVITLVLAWKARLAVISSVNS